MRSTRVPTHRVEVCMRKLPLAAGLACLLVLLAAVSPQDQDLQARVAKLEEQSAKLQRQREELQVHMDALEKWRDQVKAGGTALDSAVQQVELAGFTKAAVSAESREKLVRALKDLSTSLKGR